jgi:hypothetical protein
MGRDSEETLRSFLARAGLTDACRALACSDPERIDRVMYRSAPGVELHIEKLIVDNRFVRPDGMALSDHEAVGAVVRWTRVGSFNQARIPGGTHRGTRAKSTD